MADLYTHVENSGYLCRGRKTRAEAIAESRQAAAWALAEAQERVNALNVPDDELLVVIQRGSIVERVLEVLKPDVAG